MARKLDQPTNRCVKLRRQVLWCKAVLVITACGFFFAYANIFTLCVVSVVNYMQVCSEDTSNFPQFTTLSLSYLWIVLLTLNSQLIT